MAEPPALAAALAEVERLRRVFCRIDRPAREQAQARRLSMRRQDAWFLDWPGWERARAAYAAAVTCAEARWWEAEEARGELVLRETRERERVRG